MEVFGVVFPCIRDISLCATDVFFYGAKASSRVTALTMHLGLQIFTASWNLWCGKKCTWTRSTFILSPKVSIFHFSMKEKDLIDAVTVILTMKEF
jgi:hypothetical protein